MMDERWRAELIPPTIHARNSFRHGPLPQQPPPKSKSLGTRPPRIIVVIIIALNFAEGSGSLFIE
jgi:hypothetical protein